MANFKRKLNWISCIEWNGAEFSDMKSVKRIFVDFFKNIFDEPEAQHFDLDWSLLYPSGPCLTELDAPFSREEIKLAVFSFERDKSPGPDGFTMVFFQHFWDIVCEDVFALFQQLYDQNLDLDRLNYAILTLIPKIEVAKDSSDFRPISLVHSCIKNISKILANHLQPYLQDLIDPSQTAFIKGRCITDSVLCANEILHHSRRFETYGAVCKLDFRKAFDRVDSRFLIHLLANRNFPPRWISWVSIILLSSKVAVNINSELTDWIFCKRGLRQGDPLSPFLFILAVDPLCKMQNTAAAAKIYEGAGNPWSCGGTKILQYADDTLVFLRAERQYCAVSKIILLCFELISGLSVNFRKSSISCIGRSSDSIGHWALRLNCPEVAHMFKYLGLLLRGAKPSKADWLLLIQKLERKLASWKSKHLSFCGRLTLINLALTALPLYFMSLFKLPMWVIKRIDTCRRSFLWSGASSAYGVSCKVNWRTVSRQKDEGGLGVKDITQMNMALLAKWGWRLLKHDSGLWRRQIEFAYHEKVKRSLCWKPPRRCSNLWKNVINSLFGTGFGFK